MSSVSDFLESFYMKYGSFIPLSETDVLEYLKKKGNSDLNNRKLDIPGEVRRYRAGLASVPVAGFMVSYNKHTLSLEDLGTLEEQNWLNDQVINMYGELIMEATQHKVHFFNSFFHKQLAAKGYEGVKRWTKKVDLFSKWLLLVPIHLEIHWSLITVDMATKTISYYDSQGIVFKHTIDVCSLAVVADCDCLSLQGIPQQKNDSDCGVFVLEYCRRLSVKQPLRFSQEDMPHIRKRIYKELCDCRLSD
uniref:SUMO specific peptidase 5 n=1 Tax=Myripristis murdjan TaxID=586833 RepID=A0A667XXJ7_9TELE